MVVLKAHRLGEIAAAAAKSRTGYDRFGDIKKVKMESNRDGEIFPNQKMYIQWTLFAINVKFA